MAEDQRLRNSLISKICRTNLTEYIEYTPLSKKEINLINKIEQLKNDLIISLAK